MPRKTKRCPYCAETIKAEAIICRFCGRDLAPLENIETEKQASIISDVPIQSVPSETSKDVKIVVGLVIACLALLIFYYFAFAQPSAQPVFVTPTSVLSNSPAQSLNNDTSWFSGGTLHKSTVGEWRKASYANRLATSADFVAATQNVDYGNMTEFKRMATDLETCVSTAVSGGNVDNEKVVFISSMCTVLLFPK